MKGIFKDIESGALPAEEIPSFIGWAIRKAFWTLAALAIIGTLAAMYLAK